MKIEGRKGRNRAIKYRNWNTFSGKNLVLKSNDFVGVRNESTADSLRSASHPDASENRRK